MSDGDDNDGQASHRLLQAAACTATSFGPLSWLEQATRRAGGAESHLFILFWTCGLSS